MRHPHFLFFGLPFLVFIYLFFEAISLCVSDNFALLLHNPSHPHWARKLKDLAVFPGALWEAQGVIRQQEQSCNNKNTAIAG